MPAPPAQWRAKGVSAGGGSSTAGLSSWTGRRRWRDAALPRRRLANAHCAALPALAASLPPADGQPCCADGQAAPCRGGGVSARCDHLDPNHPRVPGRSPYGLALQPKATFSAAGPPRGHPTAARLKPSTGGRRNAFSSKRVLALVWPPGTLATGTTGCAPEPLLRPCASGPLVRCPDPVQVRMTRRAASASGTGMGGSGATHTVRPASRAAARGAGAPATRALWSLRVSARGRAQAPPGAPPWGRCRVCRQEAGGGPAAGWARTGCGKEGAGQGGNRRRRCHV